MAANNISMYNHEHISKFIEMVNKKAEAAAQAVYDEYEPELINRIKNQLRAGDRLYAGMGTCFIENKNKKQVGEMLADELAGTLRANVSAGFCLNDITK